MIILLVVEPVTSPVEMLHTGTRTPYGIVVGVTSTEVVALVATD